MSKNNPIRTLQFTPFLDLTGANRAMLTLVAEVAKRGPTVVYSHVDNEFAAEARKLGVTVALGFDQNRMPKSRLARMARIIGVLKRTAREHDIQLVHSHSAMGNHYCWPLKVMTGLPLVTHQRDNYKRDYFHLGLGASDRIITVSEWIRKGLPARLAARAVAIHDAVELPDLPAPSPRQGTLRIGMAGRCNSDKGMDLFVTAALSLAERYPFEAHVWGLQDNEYGRQLRQQVASAPAAVQERFHLEGFRTDIETFYDHCDVVVIPSRYPDPFPRMVSESMAHYKTVIVAGHGGMVEIVDHNQTGLIFAPGDAGSLADQLAQLMGDENLRYRLALAGREAVARRLAPAPYADAVEAVYASVLSGKGKRS